MLKPPRLQNNSKFCKLLRAAIMAPFAPHSTFGEATEKNKRAAQQQMSVDGHPLKKTILSVAASEENKLVS
jgi:hypothetical protein